MNIKSNSGMSLPELMTVQELSQLLRINKRSIWRLIASGKLIPPLRVGGSIRWKKEAVVQWIDQGCPSVTPSTKQQ